MKNAVSASPLTSPTKVLFSFQENFSSCRWKHRLALRLRTEMNAWVPTLGAAAIVVGAISGALFIYRQTTDPLSTYEGAYSGMQTLYYWLNLAGLLLFGIAFLQADLPAWLGYLAAGASVAFGIFFIFTGTGFATLGLVTLLSLVIAIVLLRQ